MRDATLTITFKDGSVSVIGPIDDPMTCYALLECARDAIFTKAMERQRLVRPASVIPGLPEFGRKD